jgi:hypothetical protein
MPRGAGHQHSGREHRNAGAREALFDVELSVHIFSAVLS